MSTIDNTQDVIDSRDVIARIEELQAERDNLIVAIEEAESDYEKDRCEAILDDWNASIYAAEIEILRALAKEASDYATDWEHGEILIRDDYFTEYAIEMLQDRGDLPAEIPHYIVIDEEATARNIQMDYTAVDFDGVTYWIR